MKAKLLLIAGFLMAPICVVGLFWQWRSIWVLCPQALIVMFAWQWQHTYDSIGAADYPDLVVGALYYPFVGWLLGRAVRRGHVPPSRCVRCFVARRGYGGCLDRCRDEEQALGAGVTRLIANRPGVVHCPQTSKVARQCVIV